MFGWRKKERHSEPLRTEELAVGGSAIVYRCIYDEGWHEVEKRLLPKFQANPDYESLQAREFQLLRALDHPLVVRAFGLDERQAVVDGSTYVLRLESLEGAPLSDVMPFVSGLSKEQRFTWGMNLASQLTEVLSMFRHQTIVHGDLCPENIFVCLSGLIKIVDFATAFSPTVKPHPFQVHGRKAFRAPEVRDTGKISFEADTFAAGKILEEIWGEDLQIYPKVKEILVQLIQERKLPAFSGYQSLKPLPDWQKICVYRPERKSTQLILSAWDPRAWVRWALAPILWISIGLSMTSWMPQVGRLSVNALPIKTSMSVNVLGSHLWTDRPFSQEPVLAGKVRITFQLPGNVRRVIVKEVLVLPGEDVKVFEDFRKIDTLAR